MAEQHKLYVTGCALIAIAITIAITIAIAIANTIAITIAIAIAKLHHNVRLPFTIAIA